MEGEAVFSLLHDKVRRSLSELGYRKPTPPQEACIPHILHGDNVLLIAPTGLGKTEAAMLPVLSQLLKHHTPTSNTHGNMGRGFRAIYITPLRALNRDMKDRLERMASLLGLTVGVRHGDTSQSERTKQTRDPPDILVTTPETLQILFMGSRLRAHLSYVQYVVVDEIHELADSERGIQLSVALERLERHLRVAGREDGFQRIGLSATVGNPDTVAHFLQGSSRPVKVLDVYSKKGMDITVEAPGVSRADRNLFRKHFSAHTPVLGFEMSTVSSFRRSMELIEDHVSTLLFVNTRDNAENLRTRFGIIDKDYPVRVHHGSLARDVRIEAENAFKSGTSRALVCTSSLELGIDVGHTDLVVQYHSPRNVSRLVQRVGRSGHRWDAVSRGVVITQGSDDLCEALAIARRASLREVEDVRIRTAPWTVLANQLASMSMDRGLEDRPLRKDEPKDSSSHDRSMRPEFDPYEEVEKEHYGYISLEDALEVFNGATPFRDLTNTQLEEVVNHLHNLRILHRNEREFRQGPRCRDFYWENLSMIPDEKRFLVRNLTSRKPIGLLDERFVIDSVTQESTFIMRGTTWKVADILDQFDPPEVHVHPFENLGAMPSWIGEDLPVPFDVALEVGRLRTILATYKGTEEEQTLKKTLGAIYRIDPDILGPVIRYVRDMEEPRPQEREEVQEEMDEEETGEVQVLEEETATIIGSRPSGMPPPEDREAVERYLTAGFGSRQETITVEEGSFEALGSASLPHEWGAFFREQEGEEFSKASLKMGDVGATRPGMRAFVVFNTPFGSTLNATISKVVSAFLSQQLGQSVGTLSDAYRVMLELPQGVRAAQAIEVIRSLRPEAADETVRFVVDRASTSRYDLVTVARKMGALRRDADLTGGGYAELKRLFNDDILKQEVVRRVVFNRLDPEGLGWFLDMVQKGKVDFSVGRLTRMGRAGIQERKELMMPSQADWFILLALKQRLMEARLRLICINCNSTWTRTVEDATPGEEHTCSRCSGTMVAAVSSRNEDAVKDLEKWKRVRERFDPEDAEHVRLKRAYERLRLMASLISSHGASALICIAGRGIGPTGTARILAKGAKDEKAFLRLILQAELTFAKTKRFWD